jgi:hypothetical protein
MSVQTAALAAKYAGVWYMTPTTPDPELVARMCPGVPCAPIRGANTLTPCSTP